VAALGLFLNQEEFPVSFERLKVDAALGNQKGKPQQKIISLPSMSILLKQKGYKRSSHESVMKLPDGVVLKQAGGSDNID
jgi:hypothetical protein